MMRWLCVIAIALGGCVSPPATPEACREDISLGYGSRVLLQLAHETSELEWRARHFNEHQDPLGGFTIQIFLRERTIAQCIAHHWPSRVVRCFRDATTFEDCTDDLPHADCVALEGALDIHDRIHPRLCGEPY